jgi:hypothetical protein
MAAPLALSQASDHPSSQAALQSAPCCFLSSTKAAYLLGHGADIAAEACGHSIQLVYMPCRSVSITGKLPEHGLSSCCSNHSRSSWWCGLCCCCRTGASSSSAAETTRSTDPAGGERPSDLAGNDADRVPVLLYVEFAVMVVSFLACTLVCFNGHRYLKALVLIVAGMLYLGVHLSLAWSALRAKRDKKVMPRCNGSQGSDVRKVPTV